MYRSCTDLIKVFKGFVFLVQVQPQVLEVLYDIIIMGNFNKEFLY